MNDEWNAVHEIWSSVSGITYMIDIALESYTGACTWNNLTRNGRIKSHVTPLSEPVGYARATCRRHTSLRVPSPESCAMFLDCNEGTWPDMTQGQVFECPYPGLFSPVTRSCADFRQVEHLCGGRRVPRAPCEFAVFGGSVGVCVCVCERERESFYFVALESGGNCLFALSLLDLKKAFDLVDHRILPTKLSVYLNSSNSLPFFLFIP